MFAPSTVPGSPSWREAEFLRLIDFAGRARDPRGGFGWLSGDGTVEATGPRPLWITCRMTHVFCLGALRRIDGCAELAEHGRTALHSVFRDREHGGWIDDPADATGLKAAYSHAFVALATSSLRQAGLDTGDLLGEALDVLDTRFWTGDDGLMRDTCAADWTEAEDYRGANSMMHLVEAVLAAADALAVDEAETARRWRHRALLMTTRIVHEFAAGNDWRIPEHYDAGWTPLLDYNRGEPAHPFRPFGATCGHALEWARLCLQQYAAGDGPRWLLDDAVALADRAVADGWAVDGADGFVYTTDWTGAAVVRERMHWVLAEALGAASALARTTGAPRWVGRSEQWWAYAERHLLDRQHGSWHHELDTANRPAHTVWVGKPDVYHALQACLLPQAPVEVALAAGLRRQS